MAFGSAFAAAILLHQAPIAPLVHMSNSNMRAVYAIKFLNRMPLKQISNLCISLLKNIKTLA